MSKRVMIPFLLFSFVLAFLVLTQPVSAGPQPQVAYQTPTAYPDGRVIYLVQPNDTCLRVELLTGVKVEQLRSLNRLDQNCTLVAGAELILTIVTPVPSVTPNPDMTATPLLPVATASRGNGQICVQLYNDINGNAFREDTEPLLRDGAVSISDRGGQVSVTGLSTTDPLNLFCNEIPEGEYTVSMAVPDGYNATNETNVVVPVQAGDQVFVDFGAQANSQTIDIQQMAPETIPQGGNGMLMGILGGLLLLMGVGLGVYVLFMRR